MVDLEKLFRGPPQPVRALPKPVTCEDCPREIETFILQARVLARRCIACERKRLRRQLQLGGVRPYVPPPMRNGASAPGRGPDGER